MGALALGVVWVALADRRRADDAGVVGGGGGGGGLGGDLRPVGDLIRDRIRNRIRDRRASLAGRPWLEPMRVAGTSMLPTLPPGARLAVAPLRRPPRRGQLVIVRTAALPGATGLPARLVKRVVGLPGEHVRVDAAGVWVDGRLLERWRGGRSRRPVAAAAPAEPFSAHLGDGEYLVLGDRQEASTDGRVIGPVRLDDFDGIVLFVYWPVRNLLITLRGQWFWHHAGRVRILSAESGGQRPDSGETLPQG